MEIPKIIHESWHEHLQPLFDDNKMSIIKNEILPKCKFYPGPSDIFRVFTMPLDQIKVVILGQDPYPNGEANGLAFAVNEGKPFPASLKVIAKEIEREGLKTGFYDADIPHWKTLESWHEQGVFLLNTALTVEEKNAGSHLGIWQWFTREIIKIISTNNPCIWMLWGAKAQSFRDYISNSTIILNSQKFGIENDVEAQHYLHGMNIILEAPHPAAELYPGGKKSTFTGCNHFIMCNEVLKLTNKKQINF